MKQGSIQTLHLYPFTLIIIIEELIFSALRTD